MNHSLSLKFASVALLITASLAWTLNASPADKAGSKDHPILKRYEGSSIFHYSRQDFGEYKLALGRALNPFADSSQGKTIEKEQTIEGRVTRISYLAPAGRSALEVFRNYQNELKEKGFATLFTAETDSLGYMFCKRYEGLFSQIFEYNQSLAKRRAAAVVEELVARHGIKASRLLPMGASCMAPVATNRTEEGRAKNRRVELVEQ